MALKWYEGAGSLSRQATRREGQAVASGQIYDQAQADARKAGDRAARQTAAQAQAQMGAIQAMGAQSPGRGAARARQLGGATAQAAAAGQALTATQTAGIAEQRRQAVQAQLERQQERNRQTREAVIKGALGAGAMALGVPPSVTSAALAGALAGGNA